MSFTSPVSFMLIQYAVYLTVFVDQYGFFLLFWSCVHKYCILLVLEFSKEPNKIYLNYCRIISNWLEKNVRLGMRYWLYVFKNNLSLYRHSTSSQHEFIYMGYQWLVHVWIFFINLLISDKSACMLKIKTQSNEIENTNNDID